MGENPKGFPQTETHRWNVPTVLFQTESHRREVSAV